MVKGTHHSWESVSIYKVLELQEDEDVAGAWTNIQAEWD